MSAVTRILEAIENGDTRAVDKLLPAVYEDLRQLAAQKLLREKPGQTLQATALVHEAYLRLAVDAKGSWKGRTHFYAAAAEAMRRILIDNARRKKRLKRGGPVQRQLELDEVDLPVEGPSDDLIELDEALSRLELVDQTKAELVKLHYFAGLTLEESGQLLGISHRTAKRYWAYARAWLYDQITSAS